jgi:hypothetical protein
MNLLEPREIRKPKYRENEEEFLLRELGHIEKNLIIRRIKMKKVIVVFVILVMSSSLLAQQKSLDEILTFSADKNTAEALEAALPLYLQSEVNIDSNVEVIYLENSKKMKITFFPDSSTRFPRFYHSKIIGYLFYNLLIKTNSYDSFEDLVFLDAEKNLLGTVSMSGLKAVHEMINSGVNRKEVSLALVDLFPWALKIKN